MLSAVAIATPSESIDSGITEGEAIATEDNSGGLLRICTMGVDLSGCGAADNSSAVVEDLGGTLEIPTIAQEEIAFVDDTSWQDPIAAESEFEDFGTGYYDDSYYQSYEYDDSGNYETEYYPDPYYDDNAYYDTSYSGEYGSSDYVDYGNYDPGYYSDPYYYDTGSTENQPYYVDGLYYDSEAAYWEFVAAAQVIDNSGSGYYDDSYYQSPEYDYYGNSDSGYDSDPYYYDNVYYDTSYSGEYGSPDYVDYGNYDPGYYSDPYYYDTGYAENQPYYVDGTYYESEAAYWEAVAAAQASGGSVGSGYYDDSYYQSPEYDYYGNSDPGYDSDSYEYETGSIENQPYYVDGVYYESEAAYWESVTAAQLADGSSDLAAEVVTSYEPEPVGIPVDIEVALVGSSSGTRENVSPAIESPLPAVSVAPPVVVIADQFGFEVTGVIEPGIEVAGLEAPALPGSDEVLAEFAPSGFPYSAWLWLLDHPSGGLDDDAQSVF